MIRTSVAISAASSRPDSSTSAAKRLQIAIEHLGGVFFREAFERYQEKGLARPRRDLRQVLLRRQDDFAGLRLAVHRHRVPDLGEQPIERDRELEPDSRIFGLAINDSTAATT